MRRATVFGSTTCVRKKSRYFASSSFDETGKLLESSSGVLSLPRLKGMVKAGAEVLFLSKLGVVRWLSLTCFVSVCLI